MMDVRPGLRERPDIFAEVAEGEGLTVNRLIEIHAQVKSVFGEVFNKWKGLMRETYTHDRLKRAENIDQFWGEFQQKMAEMEESEESLSERQARRVLVNLSLMAFSETLLDLDQLRKKPDPEGRLSKEVRSQQETFRQFIYLMLSTERALEMSGQIPPEQIPPSLEKIAKGFWECFCTCSRRVADEIEGKPAPRGFSYGAVAEVVGARLAHEEGMRVYFDLEGEENLDHRKVDQIWIVPSEEGEEKIYAVQIKASGKMDEVTVVNEERFEELRAEENDRGQIFEKLRYDFLELSRTAREIGVTPLLVMIPRARVGNRQNHLSYSGCPTEYSQASFKNQLEKLGILAQKEA